MSSYQTQSQHEKGLEKKKAPISSTKKHAFFGSVLLYSIVTIFLIYSNKEKRAIFMNLIKNKQFLISLTIVCLFVGYTLNLNDDDDHETEKLKKATKHGLIALLIAIMASLDLKIAPFWFVWLTSYYLDISG